jgi:hypothetical protein
MKFKVLTSRAQKKFLVNMSLARTMTRADYQGAPGTMIVFGPGDGDFTFVLEDFDEIKAAETVTIT